MKKIILLVLGMVFLTNCENNVAVKPEERESLTENKNVQIGINGLTEKSIKYIKEHECNTFLEAFEKRYDKESAEKLWNIHKDKIREVEKLTKSKFYFYKNWYFFTPIDTVKMRGKIAYIYIPYLDKFSIKGTESVIVPSLL